MPGACPGACCDGSSCFGLLPAASCITSASHIFFYLLQRA
jgi:hypothetical protein